MNSQQLAKQNGNWGESTAMQILETHFGKIIFTNDLIDYQSESGVYIEIKTCQKSISSGNPKYPIRHGRFVLTKPQHTFLIANDGYYVFLVKDNDLLIKTRIIKAKLISFTPVLQWQRVFEISSDSGRFNGVSLPGNTDMPQNPDTAQMPGKRGFVDKTSGGEP